VFLLAGWISRQQLIVVEYLKAENRMLRERLKGRSLRFMDKEWGCWRARPSAFHVRFFSNWGRSSRPTRCCAGIGN
jgi:hypothetical protein